MSEHDDDFEVRDARQPNHFWIDNEIYLDYGPVIGVYGFAVYCALCYHADAKGEAYPSYGLLGRQLRLSRNTIREALAVLEDVKLIKIEPRRTKLGDATSNLYTLANVKSLQRAAQQHGGPPRDLRLVAELGGSPHDPPGGSPHDPPGSPHDPPGSPHDPPVGRQVITNKNHINKTQGKKNQLRAAAARAEQAAAAAAAVFGAIISPTDALRLVETHPACIDHAEALVREASKPKINDPAGMLVHLVTTGWIPPAVSSNGHGPADEEDGAGYLVGYCATCAQVTFGSCGHDEQQPAAVSRPRRRGRQPA
jgi:hypothetical protein